MPFNGARPLPPLRRRRRRPAAAGGLAVTALVAAACGGSHHAAPAATAPVTTASTTPPTSPPTTARHAAPFAPSPLTGLPAASVAQLREPAVVVKIDNVAGAFPQTGVDQADVVFEEMVEGGLTRLAAVFQSTYPQKVGPVRSGRLTDIAIVDDLDHPVLAFAGANGLFLPQLRSQPIDDVDIDNRGDLFVREGPHAAPHDVYTDLVKDAATDTPSAPPGPLFAYHAATALLGGVGVAPASQVSVSWSAAAATWTYGPATRAWSRVMNGAPDIDSAGHQVTATNVIVQPIPYTIAAQGYEGSLYISIPEGHLIGSGPVWVLSGGRVVEGTWKRTSLTSPATYTDSRGAPITLAPGRTWVELTPAGTTPAIR